MEENTRSGGGGPFSPSQQALCAGQSRGVGQVGDRDLTLEKVARIGGSNMTVKVLVTGGVWGRPWILTALSPRLCALSFVTFFPGFRYQGCGAWAWLGRIHSPILLPIQQVWWKMNASPCLLSWLLRIKHLVIREAGLPAFSPQQLRSLPGAPSMWVPSTPT